MTDRLAGILLGTAVGDAIGLPAEGLSPRRRRRMMRGQCRHRLFFRRGLCSDDTEHTLFVAQSLLLHPDSPVEFQHRLAWHLRWWLASVPPGVGWATLRACLRMWRGLPPSASGVRSAGNGPAMRAALIGGYFHGDRRAIHDFVLAATTLTHTHPRALTGAMAVARTASWAVEHEATQKPPLDFLPGTLAGIARDDPAWCYLIDQLRVAQAEQMPVTEFALSLGLHKGVSGYIYHTVPVAIYAWLRHYGDFHDTVEAALDCGGDTDTVCAIAGALAGATVGAAGIPELWLRRIIDWPRSLGLLRNVAERLAEQQTADGPKGEVPYFWPAVLPRNMCLLALVLLHGLRRLAPPY